MRPKRRFHKRVPLHQTLETRLPLTIPIAHPDVFDGVEDGVIAEEPGSQVLVPAGSEWRYLDTGLDQGVAWRFPEFNDEQWASGDSQFGFGDGDEATVVNFGGNPNNRFPTTYFRTRFDLDAGSTATGLLLELLRDDGAAVYLNGEEVLRDNIPANARFNEFAITQTQNESNLIPYPIDHGLLRAGENVLAVEVHLSGADDIDMSFDLQLTALTADSGVLVNDEDADGDSLVAELTRDVEHGQLELNEDGTFRYTPVPDFYGTDTFAYRANDGQIPSEEVTVTLNVAPINDEPIGNPDFYHVQANSALQILEGLSVLRNDFDVDSAALTTTVATDVTNGQLALASDGSFNYTPDDGFLGTDSFTYIISDAEATSLPISVTLFVTALNAPPNVVPDTYTVLEDNVLDVVLAEIPPPLEIFSTDFESGIPAEITGAGTLVPVQGFSGLGNDENTFAGSFLHNDTDLEGNGDPATPTTLTLTNLPPHDSLDLKFLLGLLDHWDGSQSFFRSPDRFNVTVDGQPLFSHIFDTEDINDQSYSAGPGVQLAHNQDLWQQNGTLEAAYDMSVESVFQGIPHTSSDLTVSWFASGDGYRRPLFFGNDTESWAIDNVAVVLHRGAENATVTEELIPLGVDWRYLDDGSDQGIAWRESAFDDSAWQEGPAELGYGDGDEATVVGFGGNPDARFATTYFRREFDWSGEVADIQELTLSLLRDDGAAVYINGVEVVRDNLAPNAQFDTFATNTTFNETTLFEFAIDPQVLVPGTNIVAVEIHQESGTSSDISFNLSLSAVIDTGAPADPFGVLNNDQDPDEGPLQANILSQPQHGQLQLAADGTFTYTPNPNYNGTDTFTYQAVDAHGEVATSSVTITITPGPNERPIVQPLDYVTPEDSVLSIPPGLGLLSSAIDEDGDIISAQLFTSPQHGSVVIAADGSFDYTPQSDFFGMETFEYVASDAEGASEPAVVSITVTPTNDSPHALDDVYYVQPGQALEVAVVDGILSNDEEVDGATLSASLIENVANGTLNLQPDGSFVYTPNPGFSGVDTFIYVANDGDEDSLQANVQLVVDARPAAVEDSYSTTEDTPLQRGAPGVLANDVDPEGSALSATLVSGPSAGALELLPSGEFTYQPFADFVGQDSFVYQAFDGGQPSVEVTVVIDVLPVNDAPVAVADMYEVLRGGTLSVGVVNGLMANDTDVDGDALVATVEFGSGPENGTLDWQADGSFVYTPDPAFTGSDSFRYSVSDGNLTSPLTEVEIDVTDPAEDVVITEIMYHPATENDAHEFVELRNTGLGSVNLSGWQFSRGVSFTFPDVVLGAGEFLIVAADTAAFEEEYGQAEATLVGNWQGRLSNSGETIELEDDTGERIDRVSYADQGDWALRRPGPIDRGELGWVWLAGHDGDGRSLELINEAAANRRGQNWAASATLGGSPGQLNTVASSMSAPFIYDVKHRPAVPLPNQEVFVVADLSDDLDRIRSAEVHYRVSSLNGGPFLVATMHDDGLHDDGEANDGEYGALLPGQADGTVVEFYVVASDEEFNQRTWPAPTDNVGTQGANAHYQVDSEAYDGDQPILRLVLSRTDEAALLGINRQSNALMNATLINVDGTGSDIRYATGVRIRGNGSRTRNPPNYRVNIPSDDPWQGVDAINLNSQYPHGQLLGMTLFERSLLPQEDATASQLRINGVQYATPNVQQGSFARLEVTNSHWADNHFPLDSTGNVYRGIDGLLLYRGEEPGPYATRYNKQTNSSQADWSDLIGLTRALDQNQTPDNVFMETFEQVADVDQWMRFLAVNALLVNEENGLINGNGDDYSLFCGVVDPRCILFPHDMDTIFAEGDFNAGTATTNRDLFEPRNLPAFDRILDVPEYLDLYYHHLEDLATTVFSPEQLLPLMDDLLGDWVDPNVLNEMKTFAQGRVQFVLSQIPASVVIPPVATISGEPPARSPLMNATLTIGGESVVQYQYRLNDGPLSAPVDVSQPIQLVDLQDGEYFVSVVGINANGRTQPETQATVSQTWVVDSGYSQLVINEVLASNLTAHAVAGEFPDVIELHNRGTSAVDLAGFAITDDLDVPDAFVFPPGTQLESGEYLVLYGGNGAAAGQLYVGFSLDRNGEGVYLLDAPTDTGQVLDRVEFGIQLDDYSIGRNADFQFELNVPTIGQSNQAEVSGDVHSLRINEWLASGDRFTNDDFVELYNPTQLPVDLGGLYLTDSPVGWPDRHQIAALSFLEADGYVAFTADGNSSAGADHLDFSVNANRDSIALFDQNLDLIDIVVVLPQTTDVSEGLSPDGSRDYEFFSIPTPGAPNVQQEMSQLLIDYLRVTEIMYNPPGATEDEEFIEFQNTGPLPLDLTGVRLTTGVDFVFPEWILQPGEFVVIVNDLLAFESRYGGQLPVAGQYSGNLDNGGERLAVRLRSPLDIDIQRFRYDDEVDENWPPEADNRGASLVIVDTNGDYDDGLNWQASLVAGGTPGQAGLGTQSLISVLNVQLNTGPNDPDDLPAGPQPTSWQQQRSLLESIRVEFNVEVSVTPADFVLWNLGVNAPQEDDQVVPLSADQIVVDRSSVVILFDAANPLADGVYSLEVLPTVTSNLAGEFDGNGDGTPGDAFQWIGSEDNDFYQLTAEFNGDRGVSVFDFPTFSYWFGEATEPGGTAPLYADLNRDGGVSIFDFAKFAEQFGSAITFPQLARPEVAGNEPFHSLNEPPAARPRLSPLQRPAEDLHDEVLADMADDPLGILWGQL